MISVILYKMTIITNLILDKGYDILSSSKITKQS